MLVSAFSGRHRQGNFMDNGSTYLVLFNPSSDRIQDYLIRPGNSKQMLNFGVLPPLGRRHECLGVRTCLLPSKVVTGPLLSGIIGDKVFVGVAPHTRPVRAERYPGRDEHKRLELVAVSKLELGDLR